MLEGQLGGQVFGIETTVTDGAARLLLTQGGREVGQTLVERNPPGEGIVLWDIGVRPELRRKGLAAVMTWCVFRELIGLQKTASFRIRMITSVKPDDRGTEIQNLGICVVANRLGLTPEFDLARLLQPDNISKIEVIPAGSNAPPGFKISIKTFPLLLIAFLLDRDTHKPVSDFDTYVRLSRNELLVLDWVRGGHIVVSNGNYWLTTAGAGRFLNSLAVDPQEAEDFRQRLRVFEG